MSLQSQLQKGADALAIAGAAELDRMPDSTGRAVNAINNLITNSSVFGTGADCECHRRADPLHEHASC